MVVLGKPISGGGVGGGGGLQGKLSSSNSSLCSPPNDVVFVVEGTALCGAYLNELKQTYIFPALE